MDRKSHELITEAIFSKPYGEVHEWIDSEFAAHPGYSHWQYHHHLQAIEDKYGIGTVKYRVALLHIITDWVSHWGKVCIPKNDTAVLIELALMGY